MKVGDRIFFSGGETVIKSITPHWIAGEPAIVVFAIGDVEIDCLACDLAWSEPAGGWIWCRVPRS